MRDKLTPRQMRAWSLCALSVPAAMALPGSGWLWVLGGSVLACVLTVCLQVMQRRSGLCMREAFDQAFGTGGGRVAAAAELLWLLFAASGAAAASQIAFEDDLGPFLSAIPLLLAALAGQKGTIGRRACLRGAGFMPCGIVCDHYRGIPASCAGSLVPAGRACRQMQHWHSACVWHPRVHGIYRGKRGNAAQFDSGLRRYLRFCRQFRHF